jgi:hypothetical protein
MSRVAPHTPNPRGQVALRSALLAASMLACKSDQPCIIPPCPPPQAGVVFVSAANAPGGIVGVVFTVGGAATSSGACSQDPVSICRIYGGTGTYAVQISAPGYVTKQLSLTVTGTDAGCNTCGRIDTQQVSVTLQPAS